MADQKISQLTGGGAAQATDEYVVARAGGNNKITGANVAAAATSVGTLTSLTVSGNTTVGQEVLRSVDTSYLRISGGNSAGTGGNVIGFGESHATVPGQLSLNARGTGNMTHTIATGAYVWNGGAVTAELMRLTSGGNLGLGVTPSAWGSGWIALDMGARSAFVSNGGGNTTDVWHNAFVDSAGNPKYKATAAASFYRLSGGQHLWYNAASGTAGDTITFTQAMTLDASGNLAVGTTTIAERFRVKASNTTGSGAYTYMNCTNEVDADLQFYVTGSAATDKRAIIGPSTSTALAFNTAGSERARITTSTNRLMSLLGTFGLQYGAIASGQVQGDFTITVGGLNTLSGSAWRTTAMIVFYAGIDGNQSNETTLLTLVKFQGLSTWAASVNNNIVGTATISTANASSTGVDVTFDIPDSNNGSVMVFLLGGLGGDSPTISIAG